MAVFEMPIEELREYRGVNPKPTDFDDYWRRALDEMNSQNPRLEIKKRE